MREKKLHCFRKKYLNVVLINWSSCWIRISFEIKLKGKILNKLYYSLTNTVEFGYIIHEIYHPAAYIGHFRPEPNFYIIKPSGYIMQPSGYVGHFERCERELSRKNNAQNSLERGFLGRRVRNVPIGNFILALNSATRFRGSCRTVFRSWLNFGHQLLPALMVKNFPLQLQYRGAD